MAKKIKQIEVSFFDELLENEDFVKNVSKSKTQVKLFNDDEDWQSLARVLLDKFARLLLSGCVESINITRYE